MSPLHPSRTACRETLASTLPDVPMDDVVERAIKAAIESLPNGEWALLEPSERTGRIYHELRRIDAERAAHSAKSESSH